MNSADANANSGPSSNAIRPLSNRTIAVTLVLALLVAVATIVALLTLFGADSEADKIRIEALKTAASIGLGTGGVVALVLAARRQRYTELTLEHQYSVLAQQRAADAANERDAKERRVTELYIKAAEQLGSDRAPVRMAGLYALERVGADNAEQRTTILEVICAYLRMPFNPPAPLTPSPEGQPSASDIEARLELEVRLTAQRILTRHLHNKNAPTTTISPFWGTDKSNPVIDLSGATLIRFEIDECTIADADFRGTHFYESTNISRSDFTGRAIFSGAVFDGHVDIVDCQFRTDAIFSSANFKRSTRLDGTQFHGDVSFERANFRSSTQFRRITTDERAIFKKCMFHELVTFDEFACRSTDYIDFSNSMIVEQFVDGSRPPAGWHFESDLSPVDGTVSITSDIPYAL